MSKALITATGLIVSIGIIALGFFLAALPILVQSIAVDSQTATVETTNDLYQSQVDRLNEQRENIETIDASVDGLRAQIPSSAQLDDVFEVIGNASAASGVTIVTITAGESAPFVARTSAVDGTEPLVPDPNATDTPDTTDSAAGDGTPGPTGAVSGRQQVDVVVSVRAPDMDRATAFLDALRAGPRLLSSITATATNDGEGVVGLQITAMTYVDTEE